MPAIMAQYTLYNAIASITKLPKISPTCLKIKKCIVISIHHIYNTHRQGGNISRFIRREPC